MYGARYRALVLAPILALVSCSKLLGIDKFSTSDSDANPSAADATVDATVIYDAGLDATVDADPSKCDPVAQTGCDPGQKCAWIRTAASPTMQTGVVGCVADGDKLLNSACAWGLAGATTGFDDCKAGMVCLATATIDAAGGTCAAICDFTAGPGSCATNYACGRFSAYFNGPNSVVGLCAPTCDPLKQTRDYDGAVHCGGPLDGTGQPTTGCDGFPSGGGAPSQFTCTRVLHPNDKSDAYAYDPAFPGNIFLNSCAAGYIPMLYDNTVDAMNGDQTKIICVAYCKPGATSVTAKANANGVAPYTCAAAGAAAPHECRFWDYLESDTTPESVWSTGLGFCMNYPNYTFDGSSLNPPQSPTQPQPSCTTLSATGHIYDPTITDTQIWGCEKRAGHFTGLPTTRPRFRPLLDAAQMRSIVGAPN